MNSPGSTLVDLHDQVIRQNCRTLKTPTIAAQYQRLADAAAREGHSHVRYLDALLGAEIDERGRKAVLRRVKEARLPRLKTLQEFDFAQSPVSAARIADLAAGGYIARAEPVLLIGEAGTGKDWCTRRCVSTLPSPHRAPRARAGGSSMSSDATSFVGTIPARSRSKPVPGRSIVPDQSAALARQRDGWRSWFRRTKWSGWRWGLEFLAEPSPTS